ncbi:hypothetical protein CC86DRAFT_371356 [Ophiobolus disseminans]|uniref:Heterokaryon incompatibility domain-containing protein n=1 Tax=Ophiobolus disseminans TaxID=1469910 RepID=A0A6A6ZVK1_9PLEO|nr:hypothetical protein CC86DRAFT_371356 [Ophiobolus disseminans]
MTLMDSTSISVSSHPQYSISVGDTVLSLGSDNLLDLCWTDGLDTPCSICKRHFDNAVAPPVRTLQLLEASPKATPAGLQLPSIKITNSHLRCLKLSNIKFFPVSHAWHKPVARAYATRESSIEATRMVFELPVRILVAASQRFGSDVQIWHDYISIPQWQDSFRGTTILPQIFQIFKYGGTSLIHLDDEPTFDIHELPSSQDLSIRGPAMQCLFSARWFRRMWIIVEFTMCQDSYLMNSRFEIMPGRFSSLMEEITRISQTLPAPLEWMASIPMFSKDRSTHNCLGHVYDLLANQGCRSFRDYFIAACAMLEQDHDHRALAELPKDAQDACLWVSKRALERGDYSPLLLRPPNEPQHGRVRWLKGYMRIDEKMWGIGVQTNAAYIPPTILPDDSVQLEVRFLGALGDFSPNFDGESRLLVQCMLCKSRIHCGASMWREPKGAANLYLVPGLTYLNARCEHIGIVVEDAQVIGRALLGAPPCNCSEVAHIRLE